MEISMGLHATPIQDATLGVTIDSLSVIEPLRRIEKLKERQGD